MYSRVMSFVRRMVGTIFRAVSDELLKNDPPKSSPASAAPELDSKPPAPKKPYDAKAHRTFYVVASPILNVLLQDSEPKGVRELVLATGRDFPQSTVRGTCKQLVKDGLLTETADTFPAKFYVSNDARSMAQAFLTSHPIEDEAPPAVEVPSDGPSDS